MSPQINLNPSLFPDVPVSAPHNKTDTSIAAAKKITSLSRTRRDENTLLQFFAKRGSHGATDWEIENAFGWNGSYERPRRWQLVKENLVESKPEKRRKNPSGNTMKVWTISTQGLRVATIASE